MNKAEKLYERIKNPDVDDNILELYILYIKTNKRDRPIANNRYGEDPPEDIKNALIENGKRTKEGKWTKEAIDELKKWQEEYPDVDVFDVEQLGGRRRKKKSRRRRTKKKKRRRTKKKRRRTKKKRRKRRTRRKSGRGFFTKSTASKLKAEPENYQNILSEVLTHDGQKNVAIASGITRSLGHTWLCKNKNIKNALDDSVTGTGKKVTGGRC